MARADCVKKGCRYIVTCIDPTTNLEKPLGLITSVNLNSSRDDGGTTGAYLGGNEVVGWDSPVGSGTPDPAFTPTADMFQIAPDPCWYETCSSSNASCNHDITINGDYCFLLDPGGDIVEENIEEFQCERVKDICIRRHDRDSGRLDKVFSGTVTITGKNRTLTGGNDTNSSFTINGEFDPATVQFFEGFH
jgi:hypothetical protein